MPDGISISNRIDGTTERKLHAKVVDNILNAVTYPSRLMSMGDPMEGKTEDFTIDIANSTQFEWFTGLENLNIQAEDTTITLSYAHTAGTQPKVGIMLESFANAGSTGTIPLDAFKLEKAGLEALRNVGTALYGSGTGDQPNGLESIVDDGTNAGTIGGKLRSTYSQLNATVTASGGALTLAKLATLDSAIMAAGTVNGMANINVVTKTIFDFYEELIQSQARGSYDEIGYKSLPLTSNTIQTRGNLMGAAGFTVLQHRGTPVLADDFATSGVWYKLNERTFGWLGRTTVPEEYRATLTKVNLGSMTAYESTSQENIPSGFDGWFYKKPMDLPDQAGTIARFYIIGQMAVWEPRRNGKLTGINTVA